MKIENIYIESLDKELVFYIGKNAKDNFEVINKGEPDDLWFHAKDTSSCHVVVEMPDYLENNELMEIIMKGALLCKQNTQKLKNINNVPIIYTKIKNVLKTKTHGSVLASNTKFIIC